MMKGGRDEATTFIIKVVIYQKGKPWILEVKIIGRFMGKNCNKWCPEL